MERKQAAAAIASLRAISSGQTAMGAGRGGVAIQNMKMTRAGALAVIGIIVLASCTPKSGDHEEQPRLRAYTDQQINAFKTEFAKESGRKLPSPTDNLIRLGMIMCDSIDGNEGKVADTMDMHQKNATDDFDWKLTEATATAATRTLCPEYKQDYEEWNRGS